MAERPHELGDFKGRVTSRLNFGLKGYVSHKYLWTVRRRNGYTTTLLLKVLTQRFFVADFSRLKLNFIFKNRFLSHCLASFTAELL